MKKLYLAGPEVFQKNPTLVKEHLLAICSKHGVEGVFPPDVELLGTEVPTPTTALKIFRTNMALINECDAVVANMEPFRGPSMDVGTAFEMGVAEGLGKPIFGYSKSDYSYKEKVEEFFGYHSLRFQGNSFWAPDEMRVDDFELIDNLMMLGAVDNLVYDSFERAVIAAVEFFEAFGL